MRIFITILILFFSFHSFVRAGDIKEIEIEGMSIGDNLLDHFNLDHIKNFDKEFFI